MVKIRLHGVQAETEKFIESLKKQFNVLSVSGPYHDRGESQYVRYYVDAETFENAVGCITDEALRTAWKNSKKENLI